MFKMSVFFILSAFLISCAPDWIIHNKKRKWTWQGIGISIPDKNPKKIAWKTLPVIEKNFTGFPLSKINH